MRENTQEKSLIAVNKNSILYKIKCFFKNLFHKSSNDENNMLVDESNISNAESDNKKSAFMESIKKIEDDETKLLKLQKMYRSGEITEEDMTEEQIDSLCTLYDKQIAKLRKSNEIRKNRLLEYRKKLQTVN